MARLRRSAQENMFAAASAHVLAAAAFVQPLRPFTPADARHGSPRAVKSVGQEPPVLDALVRRMGTAMAQHPTAGDLPGLKQLAPGQEDLCPVL